MVHITLTEEQAKALSLGLIGHKLAMQERVAETGYTGDTLDRQIKDIRELHKLIGIVIDAEREARA